VTKIGKRHNNQGLKTTDFDELAPVSDELGKGSNNYGRKLCPFCFFPYLRIMKTSKRTLFLTLALCFSLTLLAQMESYLTCRRYTIQDGLPQMQCERVWQDSRGYIYIGTLSGFVRFDGQTFTPFLKGHRFNIIGFAEIDETVSAFDFRRQWLTDFDDVKMQLIDPKGRWLLNNFNSGSLPNGYFLLEDEQEKNRRVCLQTAKGFVPVVKGALLDQMTPDRKLYMDSAYLYVPTEEGLYRIEKNRAIRLTSKRDIFTLLRTDNQLSAFAADGVYTVCQKGLKKKSHFAFKSTDYGLIVRRFANGHIVIADEHTLYEYDGSSINEIATGFNLIKDVLVDCWDRLWVATYEGLYCYFNRNFTNYRLTDRDDIVRAISVDADNNIVMGTLNGKLFTGQWPVLNSHRSMTNIQCIEDNPANFYSPCAVNIDGTVYMAGNGDVVCYDSAFHWLHLPLDRYCFVAKAAKRLVIGSSHSILSYDPQTFSLDTLVTSIPHPWCAAQDMQGHLWVGTTFGLFMDGNKIDYKQQLIVTSMESDSLGNIFFASKDSLFIIQNGEVTPMPIPILTGHEVRSLHVSPKGFLIIAVIDGLFVCRVNEEYLLSDIRFFDHKNGFTTLEPLMATMAETSDGTVWLAGVEEMTSFRPSDLLAYDEHDTYIRPPLRWWQHWWVWVAGIILISLTVWILTQRYERLRNRKKLIRLQQEKQQREEQIEAIRKKAIEEVRDNQEMTANKLANDIVKMTQQNFKQRITLRTASGTIVVEVKDIAYFKGDGNYSQLVTFHNQDTVLTGLGALEKMLSPEVFVRADRSTLVNIHHISALLPKQRRCIFRSQDGREIETTLREPAFKRLQDLL